MWLRPTCDLALEIIAGPTIITKTHRRVIKPVQLGGRCIHRVKIGRPVAVRDLRQRRIPKDAPLHHLHYIKRGSDDSVISTEGEDVSCRETRFAQPNQHLRLALDRMRARSEARRVGKECGRTCRARWSQ